MNDDRVKEIGEMFWFEYSGRPNRLRDIGKRMGISSVTVGQYKDTYRDKFLQKELVRRVVALEQCNGN